MHQEEIKKKVEAVRAYLDELKYVREIPGDCDQGHFRLTQ